MTSLLVRFAMFCSVIMLTVWFFLEAVSAFILGRPDLGVVGIGIAFLLGLLGSWLRADLMENK